MIEFDDTGMNFDQIRLDFLSNLRKN